MSETWLKESELDIIQETITRNVKHEKYTIFSKSSMKDTEKYTWAALLEAWLPFAMLVMVSQCMKYK